MKTLYNMLRITLGVILMSTLVISCMPEQQSIGDVGQTLVKLMPDDGFISKALKMQSTTQTTTLLEVRKNVANSAALQLPTTIVLKYDADNAILNAYNTANHTTFIPLPASLYTLSPAISSGTVTLTFDETKQEHAKSIMITIPNILNFDFSKSYALAFEIQSVTGEGIVSEGASQEIVINIMAANMLDGKYEVTGTFADYVTTTWSGIYPKAVNLITLGLNSVAKYDTDYGLYTYIFETGTGASQFGAWTPCFTVDAGNNMNVYNSTTDPLPRQRTAVLYTGAGAASNKFNPVTHSFDISYQMSQLTVTPVLRNLVIEHYEYKGPR
jgi:hypothetical protein